MPKLTSKQKLIRVPRPMGTTALAQSRSHNPTPEKQALIKKQLQKLYLNQYLNNNILIKDKYPKVLRTINLTELSYILTMTNFELMRELNREIQRIGSMLGTNNSEIARVMVQKALSWSTESQSLTLHQVQILMASQGSKYVPFISKEVNGAITNLLKANSAIVDIAKLFTGTIGKDNGALPIDPGAPIKGYLTSDMAQKMIMESKISYLDDAPGLDQKQLDMGTLPEVRANYQTNTTTGSSITDLVPIEILNNDHEGKVKETREERRDRRREVGKIQDDEADDFIG